MKIVSYDPSKDREFKKFIEEIEKESERGQAIICHAYIEYLLKELLKKRLIEDKEFLKNLKYLSFSRLLTLCFITGVVTEKEKEEITLLNAIRNKFAHNIKFKSFNASNIPTLCNGLGISNSYTRELTPQEKFIKTAGHYIQRFNLELKYIKKVRFVDEESKELKMLDTLYA